MQTVKYSKAQLKIQQMAFVLIAIFIFFALFAVVFVSIWMYNSQEKAENAFREESSEIVKAMAGAPEFAFTSESDCPSCIDLDKLIVLKLFAIENIEIPGVDINPSINSNTYNNFWNIDYLWIEKIYPAAQPDSICDGTNYPDCEKLIVIDKKQGKPAGEMTSAFVTLVYYDPNTRRFEYGLGKIWASGRNIN